jgi:predicted dehydrogenase
MPKIRPLAPEATEGSQIQSVSRRDFIRAAVAAGVMLPAGLEVVHNPARAADEKPRSANSKLNLAIIGVAAKGRDNLNNVASENIVALCDIDAKRLDEVAKLYPAAAKFDDWRKVLELKNLDGVVISTPDHTHAGPTLAALQLGCAVYCEKPLTHTVAEARKVGEFAKKYKNVTQMGTQIHAGDNYRRVVEMVQGGVIGPVTKVHAWLASSVPAFKKPAPDAMPPDYVNYDLWLGPAAYRPFSESHFHFQWRYWWAFGGGSMADFFCHYCDLPFWALGLTQPTNVVCSKAEKGHDGDNEPPTRMQVDYQFPARGDQPPVTLTWYQGGWKPDGAEQYGKSSAVLFEGRDGRILADYGTNKVFMQDGKELKTVEPTIPSSIGHWKEWIEATKTKGPTTCNFAYASNLTESALLGNVSLKAGLKPLDWKADTMTIPGTPDAEQYLTKEYRKGWELPTG